MLVTNEVTWTFGNYLLLKSGTAGSRQVASLEISQPYSLSNPLTAARNIYDPVTGALTDTLPASQKLPLDIWLRVSPLPTATIDSRADFDPVTHKLSTTSFTGGYTSGLNGINLTWFSSDDPTGQVTSSQTRVCFFRSARKPARGAWRARSPTIFTRRSCSTTSTFSGGEGAAGAPCSSITTTGSPRISSATIGSRSTSLGWGRSSTSRAAFPAPHPDQVASDALVV